MQTHAELRYANVWIVIPEKGTKSYLIFFPFLVVLWLIGRPSRKCLALVPSYTLVSGNGWGS